jgi:hypothetical protein
MALRCWPREAKPASSRPSSSKASRRGAGRPAWHRSTAPSRPSRPAAGAGPPCVLAGLRLGVGHVAQRQRPSPGAISRGPRPAARPARPARCGASRRCARRRGRPDPSQKPSSAGSAAVADGAQQVVALGQRPAVGRQVADPPALELLDQRVERRRRSDGEPTTSSMSSGANSTTGSAAAQGVARRGDAVDLDALALPAAGRRRH